MTLVVDSCKDASAQGETEKCRLLNLPLYCAGRLRESLDSFLTAVPS